MTYQSPRIYLYKITFEEVPYYYYGIHKERKYNEYYVGSPYTHKWVWDFYTPKKQILQLFDFTDEGWLEAQEVEKRIIKSFYNTDKWCLNESCGGYFSLKTLSDAGKKGGQKTYELGVGVYSLTAEERSEYSRKAGKIGGKKTYELGVGMYSLTLEQKSEHSKKIAEKNAKFKKGIFGLTTEQRREIGKEAGKVGGKIGGKIGGRKSKELGVGIHKFTKVELLEFAKMGAKVINSQKWMCLETGFVSTSGPLTRYQRKRGIDTSKRKRIE